MEEEKAAAYYDELSRKGEGAAKFKQGLGFSSSSSSDPFLSNKKTSCFPPLSNFVRASSSNTENTAAENENNQDPNRTSRRNGDEDRARVLDRIHGKLNRSGGGGGGGHRRRSPSDESDKRREERRDKYDDRERNEDRHSSRKSRDRDRDGEYRERRRRRSRSYSPPWVSRDREKDRIREKEGSLKERRSGGGGGGKGDRGVDYSRLIEGYSQMTPAERVKAKMKLQLTQTAAKDTNMGMSSGWERFDFNRDAPLDDDEDETEAADDDAAVVKDIGRSFRFSAVEARREEEVKAAHDRAMFGGAATSVRVNFASETTVSAEKDGDDDTPDDDDGNHLKSTTLISDKVLSMQQGSWRDRARRLQNASEQS